MVSREASPVNRDQELSTGHAAEKSQPGTEARSADLVRRSLTVIALVAAVTLLVLLVCYTVGALLLFFAAVLLAILLRGLSGRLAATGLPPGWSLGLTVTALVVVAGLVGWLLAAQIGSQIDDLSQQL